MRPPRHSDSGLICKAHSPPRTLARNARHAAQVPINKMIDTAHASTAYRIDPPKLKASSPVEKQDRLSNDQHAASTLTTKHKGCCKRFALHIARTVCLKKKLSAFFNFVLFLRADPVNAGRPCTRWRHITGGGRCSACRDESLRVPPAVRQAGRR